MNPFEYVAPSDLREASSLLGSRWGQTEVLAGGTDLITSLKQGITSPRRLVSLRNIPELKRIQVKKNTVRIGATVTLKELAANPTIQEEFPSLITAIQGIGSSQIINSGTVAGDLCQRPRCWYFRNGFGLLAEENGDSLVRSGDNRYHAVFGNGGRALFVNASSLAPALIALQAEATIVGAAGREREIPVGELFQSPGNAEDREVALRANEIVTEIKIPRENMQNATYEVRHRHGLDWPYATASIALKVRSGIARDASVILGHVAPTPWSAVAASNLLNGARVDATLAEAVGQAATQGAAPLSGNAYKVQMVKTAVKRALLSAVNA
ncbi:MAG: molybdopterin dehydrogenase [Verrucomicrobia bacterium]|jgi:xanthine dehydrogenase YagS FAD-binding subunit|nr:molybdopterin dehydrogenase [Verrucomicrobiota bacterium]MDA7510357.1 FAD binding domain-containing protein [Verrucomicrobiota bacterium]MDA7667498.1 FAD binding domain-containing protein [bacterium]